MIAECSNNRLVSTYSHIVGDGTWLAVEGQDRNRVGEGEKLNAEYLHNTSFTAADNQRVPFFGAL